MNTESFVFISYRNTDKDIAYETKNILMQNGINVWMAPESIPAGSDYGSEIPKALESCSAFVIILSEDAQNSKWIPKEIDGAINNGKIIIPFKIDESTISDSFNFRLGDSQRIEAYQRMSDAYSELLNRLKEILHIDDRELFSGKEKIQPLQEKSFILQNRTDLRIESYTTPQMCSWCDEGRATGMFEFINENIDLDPDEIYLGFTFDMNVSNKVIGGISQIYVGFENFAQIFNEEYNFVFYSPENFFPLNLTDQDTICLEFVCRKIANDDDMLQDIMDSFIKENPTILLNVIVSNGYVDERFEVMGTLTFSEEENVITAENLKKSDVHHTISEYDFSQRNTD